MSETYLYKGGEKLAYALETFNVDVTGKTVADLGCNVGGFTDCLLKKRGGLFVLVRQIELLLVDILDIKLRGFRLFEVLNIYRRGYFGRSVFSRGSLF